jgi:hypothetical protein
MFLEMCEERQRVRYNELDMFNHRERQGERKEERECVRTCGRKID